MERSACFTGHRPEKIDNLQPSGKRVVTYIKKQLYQAVLNALRQGYSHFYTGMARGVDLYAAEIVLLLKQRGYPVKLTAVLPFEGHGGDWSADWRQRHEQVLKGCDEVVVLNQEYTSGCYQQRNEYMVDHSSRLIAVWNGTKSGTANTIQYARLTGKEVDMIRIPYHPE